MKNKIQETVRFYLLATQLKYKIRGGWDNNHWAVTKERLESVAEHVYGTCILALSIYSNFEVNVDINKVLKMLVLHEIGEVIIGDITPFDNTTPEEKLEKEHEAVRKVLGDLVKKEEYYSLLVEFDAKETKEAIFAFHCDKLDANIQAKAYQDEGYQNPLDAPINNAVFKSNRLKKAIEDGAKTVFDAWYIYDKYLYNDEIFSNILEFIKENNTQEIIKEISTI
ncbi:MAG: HD domain-containing protein [Clostridia bacterium]|nr:HD domain-containing protein [Clostridia bacterium]